jgi:hypothetical protein
MKLVGLALATFLGLSTLALSARADDVLRPPGGPVYVEEAPPVQAADDAAPVRQGPPRNPGGQRDPRARRAERAELRRALVRELDANGDGRLGPRERMRALRILRRMEHQLAGADRRQRARRFIQRYDINGDGNVGPREMPPGAADRLRRLDRDGDGWVEPRELRR